MKCLIAILFLASVARAEGPIHRQKDTDLQQEIDNIYFDIKNPKIDNGYAKIFTISSATISTATISRVILSSVTVSSLTVTNTLTASSATIGLANISSATIADLTYTTLHPSVSGKFIQIVSSASARDFTTTSTSYQATSIKVTITPTLTTSCIYCVATFTCRSSNITQDLCFSQLFRDGSSIGVDDRRAIATLNPTGTLNMDAFVVPYAISQYDCPSKNTSTVYEVYIKTSASAATIGVNNSTNESDIACFEIGA